jgi:hypothetical protein
MNKVKLLQGGVDTAVIELGLPDLQGDILVSEPRAVYPTLPIVIASGYEEIQLRERPGTSLSKSGPSARHVGNRSHKRPCTPSI